MSRTSDFQFNKNSKSFLLCVFFFARAGQRRFKIAVFKRLFLQQKTLDCGVLYTLNFLLSKNASTFDQNPVVLFLYFAANCILLSLATSSGMLHFGEDPKYTFCLRNTRSKVLRQTSRSNLSITLLLISFSTIVLATRGRLVKLLVNLTTCLSSASVNFFRGFGLGLWDSACPIVL